MFQLAGYDEATAQKAVKAVMNIETRLAKAARSQVELRDPHANYNKMDRATLKKTSRLLTGILISPFPV